MFDYKQFHIARKLNLVNNLFYLNKSNYSNLSKHNIFGIRILNITNVGVNNVVFTNYLKILAWRICWKIYFIWVKVFKCVDEVNSLDIYNYIVHCLFCCKQNLVWDNYHY